MAPHPVYVAVSGGGHADPAACDLARDVGRRLAELGAVVVTGGLGGAMAAACEGAKSAGGTTLGILPGDDRADANPWVDLAVATGLGEARNALVVRAADAVVAVAGAFGTLSEIALALRLGTPVVGLETWELRRSGRPDEGPDPALIVAATPTEAAELAVAAVRARRARQTGS